MSIKTFIAILLLSFTFLLPASASQESIQSDSTWLSGGSIGLDLSQLVLINPKIGAGENKMAIGGLNTLFANYKKGKMMWNNDGSLQLAVQRLGSSEESFTKNLDVLRLNSKFGYQIKEKWYGAILMTFESLLLNTYSDLSLSSNGSNYLQAQFLAPAEFILAPGLDYTNGKNWSVFLAPIAYKNIMVLNDEIAALGVHGNPWNSANDYERIKHEMGANAKLKYNNIYYEKLSVGSELNLFYDYLADEHGVEFVDVVWINELGYELFKGLSLNVLFDVRWDRDIASVLGESIVPDGLEEFRKWMITEAFVIKYNYTIK